MQQKQTLNGICLIIFIVFFCLWISVNELIDIKYEIPSDAIDCACITFKLKNELVDGVPTETDHHINVAHSDIKMLLKEMKTVRSLMDETEQNFTVILLAIDSKFSHSLINNVKI